MARELKIPAKGGGRRGRSGDVAHVGWSAGETDVLGAGYVLDEVHVVHVAVLLVHALAGRPLPLEVAPLRRAWQERRVASAVTHPKWERLSRESRNQPSAHVCLGFDFISFVFQFV